VSRQDGISSPTLSVRCSSFLALAKMLDSSAARHIFRVHGLCQRLCGAVEEVLLGQLPAPQRASRSALYGVHPFHADAAFGVLALIYLAFEDGTQANLDFLASPPLVALSLRLLAHSLPPAVARTDPALAAALAPQPIAGSRGLPASSQPPLSSFSSTFSSSSAAAAAAAPVAPVGAHKALPNAPSARVSSVPLEEQLQPFLLRGCSAAWEAALAGGQVPPFSRQTPPRGLSGAVTPMDLALYIPLRCCLSGDLGAEGKQQQQQQQLQGAAVTSNSSGGCGGGGGDGGEAAAAATATTSSGDTSRTAETGGSSGSSNGALLSRHAAPIIRDALRLSLGGKGLQALAVTTVLCASAVRELAAADGASSEASTAAASAEWHPDCRAAVARGLPPSHVLPLARLTAVLGLLNDASFLSEENTACLAQMAVPLELLGGGVGEGCTSLVSVLLSITSWSTHYLKQQQAASTASRSKRSGIGSSSSSSADENPVLEAILCCLRVLVNLTHCYAPGCKALVSSRCLVSEEMLSPRKGKSSGQGGGGGGAAKPTTGTEVWGIGVVLSVIRFGALLSVVVVWGAFPFFFPFLAHHPHCSPPSPPTPFFT
jgi:hypothetical protein